MHSVSMQTMPADVGIQRLLMDEKLSFKSQYSLVPNPLYWLWCNSWKPWHAFQLGNGSNSVQGTSQLVEEASVFVFQCPWCRHLLFVHHLQRGQAVSVSCPFVGVRDALIA